MFPLAVVAFAAVALQSPSPAIRRGSPPAHGRAARLPAVRASHSRSAGLLPSPDLYSMRARRRLAGLLRLKLLEMRKAGLERVTRAIERELARTPAFPPP